MYVITLHWQTNKQYKKIRSKGKWIVSIFRGWWEGIHRRGNEEKCKPIDSCFLFLDLNKKKTDGGNMERFDKLRAKHFQFSFFLCFFFIVNFVLLFFRHIHLYKFKDKASKDELDSLQLWMPLTNRAARADGVAWKCEREWRGARTQCSRQLFKRGRRWELSA